MIFVTAHLPCDNWERFNFTEEEHGFSRNTLSEIFCGDHSDTRDVSAVKYSVSLENLSHKGTGFSAMLQAVWDNQLGISFLASS